MQVPIDKNLKLTFEDPQMTSPRARERAFGQSDRVRPHGLDYRYKLENVGFSVKIDNYVKELPAEVVDRYGLAWEQDIYLLSKPSWTANRGQLSASASSLAENLCSKSDLFVVAWSKASQISFTRQIASF